MTVKLQAQTIDKSAWWNTNWWRNFENSILIHSYKNYSSILSIFCEKFGDEQLGPYNAKVRKYERVFSDQTDIFSLEFDSEEDYIAFVLEWS